MTLPSLARRLLRPVLALACVAALASCGGVPDDTQTRAPVLGFAEGYGPIDDEGYRLPGVPSEYLQGANRRVTVAYTGSQPPGTIEIDPHAKFLYHVHYDGTATRYPIAVGREGKGMSGRTVIRRKATWPGWTPTANMLRSEPEVYGPFRNGIPGGLRSPLGARALYLYRGGRDTYYRIHGTNDLGSIGNSGSAGCIRLFNQDIIHLYDQTEMGTEVVVRTLEESIALEGDLAFRGVELEPKIIDPDAIYSEEAIAADQPYLYDDVLLEDPAAG